jgi:putative ribosome biogenesis GTPase RsgA
LFHRTKGKPTKKRIRSRATKEGQVIDKPSIQSHQFHEMSRENLLSDTEECFAAANADE